MLGFHATLASYETYKAVENNFGNKCSFTHVTGHI